MTTKINHHVLGEITVSQTWRAKRISLSVRPPGRIRLSLPYNVPLSEAVRFVNTKQEWVLKAVRRYSSIKKPEIIVMPYATRNHSLELFPADTAKIGVRVGAGRIRVVYPLGKQFSDADVQEAIHKGIEQAWRIEAKEVLPGRLRDISERLGLPYRSVTVRNTVSKWGSCSARDDISLSLHLMRLPDHLIDYILVHELCHTIHKNHGPGFHALLDRHTGGRDKILRKEMRGYSTRW